VLLVDKWEGIKGMSKQTIASLTRKGYSQKKIAKTLGIRKMKVVTYQKTHKIGKRAAGGAKEFWKDVKGMTALKGQTRKETIKEVKFSKKWFERRQKKLTGVAKARDAMREKWQRINEGKIDPNVWEEAEGEELLDLIDPNVWEEAEGEELLDFAGYD
jgi:predicted transcriptional regulator